MATTPLTSGQWTIRPYPNSVNQTISGQDWRQATSIKGTKKEVHLKLTITGGAIPAAGIKAPSYGSVGLRRYLDGYVILNHNSVQAFTTGGMNLVWSYNTTGNAFQPKRTVTVSGTNGSSLKALATNVNASGTKTFYVIARGW